MTPLQKFQDKIGVDADNDFGRITLKAGCAYFKLTPQQGAHFFGQLAHETGGFNLFSENLNYSASGLSRTFRKYFTPQQAQEYHRQPERIANRVYSSRMGNGNESSGDGWKFRGRGAIQLTGRNNYSLFAEYVDDMDVLSNPYVVKYKYAFKSAMFFFDSNKLWRYTTTVDDTHILQLTKRINGGTNGYSHRKELTKKYYNWLK